MARARVLPAAGPTTRSGTRHGRGGRATVEPPGSGCHLRSRSRWGPVRRVHGLSTPLFLLVLEEGERSSSNHRGCGWCGWSSSGLFGRCGALWVALGTGPWTTRGTRGQLRRAASCPRAVHGLSTARPRSIHRPPGRYPQSCPQVWVKCARLWTQSERSVAVRPCPGDTTVVAPARRCPTANTRSPVERHRRSPGRDALRRVSAAARRAGACRARIQDRVAAGRPRPTVRGGAGPLWTGRRAGTHRAAWAGPADGSSGTGWRRGGWRRGLSAGRAA